MVAMPLAMYGSIISQAYFGNKHLSASIILFTLLITAAIEIYFIYKLIQQIINRRILRLGYDGELAVGQELNQLLKEGYEVYHDFPAEKFNIDHIIIGPSGVYAVETKARQKPTTGNGQADAKVVYDGQKLQFPDWVDTKSIEQTRRQAQRLSKWLNSAIGEAVSVQPVLALPGWYVERISPNGIPVINPKNFRSVLKTSKTKPLDKSIITRIVHQIDKCCRDVQPIASEGLGGKSGLMVKDFT